MGRGEYATVYGATPEELGAQAACKHREGRTWCEFMPKEGSRAAGALLFTPDGLARVVWY